MFKAVKNMGKTQEQIAHEENMDGIAEMLPRPVAFDFQDIQEESGTHEDEYDHESEIDESQEVEPQQVEEDEETKKARIAARAAAIAALIMPRRELNADDLFQKGEDYQDIFGSSNIPPQFLVDISNAVSKAASFADSQAIFKKEARNQSEFTLISKHNVGDKYFFTYADPFNSSPDKRITYVTDPNGRILSVASGKAALAIIPPIKKEIDNDENFFLTYVNMEHESKKVVVLNYGANNDVKIAPEAHFLTASYKGKLAEEERFTQLNDKVKFADGVTAIEKFSSRLLTSIRGASPSTREPHAKRQILRDDNTTPIGSPVKSDAPDSSEDNSMKRDRRNLAERKAYLEANPDANIFSSESGASPSKSSIEETPAQILERHTQAEKEGRLFESPQPKENRHQNRAARSSGKGSRGR